MLSMGFFDLIVVRRCVICRSEVASARPVCRACWRLLLATKLPAGQADAALKAARCQRCFSRLRGAPTCRFCSGRHVFFDHHRSLFGWSPAWRDAVRAWKFSGERSSCRLFGGALAGAVARLSPFDGIACVASGLRSRTRAFEPVQDLISLIRAVSDGHNTPSEHRIRKVKLAKQSRRTFQERFFEVRGSFVLEAPENVPGSVLLVDDLFTTGATANEAARLLRAAGAQKIQVISAVMREELDFSSPNGTI